MRSEDNFFRHAWRSGVFHNEEHVVSTHRGSWQHRGGHAEDVSANVGKWQFNVADIRVETVRHRAGADHAD